MLEVRALLSVDALLLSLDQHEHSEELGELEFCPEPDLVLLADAATDSPSEAPSFPLADTFLLHSLQGASKRIFLDFDGHTTSGTIWNSNFTGGAPIVTPAFSQDGNPAFSNAELLAIQEVFHRVSEDFIGFDVDVTTEDPGAAALTNSGGGDVQWGIRVVIGGSASDWYGAGAGGVAYIGSFTWNSDTPTFVFSQNLANAAKYIAEAVSHEVGHTLGLRHDGRTSPSEGYYQGHGSGETGWAPIMGVGYYKNVTQWSKGEYSSANNHEDDLDIITTRNGFGYLADDFPNQFTQLDVSGGAATIDGILERGDADTDSFFFSTSGGLVSIDLTPFSVGAGNVGANNDLAFLLVNQADGSVVQTVNPQYTLDAHLQLTLAAGTYSIVVYCDDMGNPSAGGYTDYASMGRYSLTVTAPAAEVDVSGNGISIADGDTSPISADGTDFGTTSMADGSVARTFTIVNNASTVLNLAGTPRVQISGANAADFTVTAQPDSSVNPGGTTTFTIVFDPSSGGLHTATVSILHDAGVYDFRIQGTGAGAPEIDVRGNSLSIADGDTTPSTADGTDFGSVSWVKGKAKHAFTISNTGLARLYLTGSPRVQISGAHASDFKVKQPSSSVKPGREKSFKIVFDPSADGLRTATVSIFSDDSNEGVYEFTIQGIGVTPTPEIDVRGGDISIAAGDSTSSIADGTDFGGQELNTRSPKRTFLIANTGSDKLGLTGTPRVQISGADASDFTVAKQPSSSVSAGRAKNFKITFHPTAVGLRTATVSIINSDSNESLYDFTIQGTGATAASGQQFEGSAIFAAAGDLPATDITQFGLSIDAADDDDFSTALEAAEPASFESWNRAKVMVRLDAERHRVLALALTGESERSVATDAPWSSTGLDDAEPGIEAAQIPLLDKLFSDPLTLSSLFEKL